MDGTPVAIVLGVLLGLVVLGQFALWAILAQIIQQQGRILLKLDALTNAADRPGPEVLPIHDAAPEPVGLPVGSSIGDFHLPDLAGETAGPHSWRGQRTLLVHWSTSCGFCDLIAPELAQLQSDLTRQHVQLVLASYGNLETNRSYAEEHGLKCPIVLQPDTQPVAAFNHLGTPVAYLVDESGRTIEQLAAGADSVIELARKLAAPRPTSGRRLRGERPLTESHIERTGLKAGAIAPLFSLPDVRGASVALESYRGRRVLLVFTDPHCGPCDALAPDLVRLDRDGRAHGLHVVVIGRGDAEENRRKAEQYEFTFPVALQQRWEISRAYGIFATPVGFLIDEHGLIARDVAMGAGAIVALAMQAMTVTGSREWANGRAVR